MGQLADVVWGVVVLMGVLAALGAAAMTFGADSRRCIGDSRTASRRGDWV